eukprot:234405-Chlamydomonas_euryale.AAC.1
MEAKQQHSTCSPPPPLLRGCMEKKGKPRSRIPPAVPPFRAAAWKKNRSLTAAYHTWPIHPHTNLGEAPTVTQAHTDASRGKQPCLCALSADKSEGAGRGLCISRHLAGGNEAVRSPRSNTADVGWHIGCEGRVAECAPLPPPTQTPRAQPAQRAHKGGALRCLEIWPSATAAAAAAAASALETLAPRPSPAAPAVGAAQRAAVHAHSCGKRRGWAYLSASASPCLVCSPMPAVAPAPAPAAQREHSAMHRPCPRRLHGSRSISCARRRGSTGE